MAKFANKPFKSTRLTTLRQAGQMEIFSDLFSGLGGINWEVIAQLTLVALIMLAGPAVIFVLAFRGGDL